MNLFRLPCGIPWGGARRLVLTLACLFALSGLSAQNVTLRFERAKLKTVMDEITRQCDLSFAYSREVVDADRIVSIDLKDAPIDAALQSLFPSGNGIDYAIKNRKILLSAGKQSLHVDTVVSGRVADDQNRPLVGATVVVAGTSQGTTTDLDGNFSLRVNAVDPVLKVDYLGYEPQELRVSPSQTTFDIRLALSSKAIDDVVVVGYGTVKRRDLVGAVDQVDRKVIEDRSTGTLARALQGQLPGLNITFTDSKPTRGASVNVRGSGSIGAGGSTLVLIDGVEGSINAINPQDVESVSVLKDASSSAVYGARGAFGVVLITTKSAKKGTPVINYNGSVTINRRTVTPDVVTDGLTWINWWKDCYNGYYNGSKALLNPCRFDDSLYRDDLSGIDPPFAGPFAGAHDGAFGARPVRVGLLRLDRLAFALLQGLQLVDRAQPLDFGWRRPGRLLYFGPFLRYGRHLQGGQRQLQEVRRARQGNA